MSEYLIHLRNYSPSHRQRQRVKTEMARACDANGRQQTAKTSCTLVYLSVVLCHMAGFHLH